MEKFNKKSIPLKELLLWDENPRFPDRYFNKNESELIDYFVDKNEFKIKELIQRIANDIDIPQLERIVVLDYNNSYIVIEGNRRLTSYKLLADNTISNSQKLTSFLENLSIDKKITNDFTLECLVTNDKEQALRYVSQKHDKTDSVVSWGQNERDNFKIRHGRAGNKELFRLEVSNVVKSLDIPEIMKERILGKGFITTFFRILDSSIAYKKFNFRFNDNKEFIYNDDFPEYLKIIIFEVLQKEKIDKSKKVTSRSLNKNIDKKEYLDSLKKKDTKKVDVEIEKNTKKDLFGKKTVNLPKKNNLIPKSHSRNYLIPKNPVLPITENKINNIYRELRDDLLLDNSIKSVPNAVGVLFRVFLDISLSYYAEMNGHIFRKNDRIKGKIAWVVSKLTEKGYNNRIFKSINKVGSGNKDETILSIDNFHEYVHSPKIQPTSNDLKLKWDNLQEFFVVLWTDLKQK